MIDRRLEFVLRLALAGFLTACSGAQRNDGEQPRVVDPGGPATPPSDAVILFDGSSVDQWTLRDGKPCRCRIEDGNMLCKTGDGDIFSKARFRSAQIHLEYSPPLMPNHQGQLRGNSGVYLHGRYEIQILDSYNNPTYAHGSNGGLYGQAPPLVNASRRPEEWQTYDIVFHAPRCGEEKTLLEAARLTLLHNGILIHDNVSIAASKKACANAGKAAETGPIMLQDHDFPFAPNTNMRFRNIWYRPLD